MAQQQFQLDQEQLCCSICLDLLKDPVTVACGHSYCMGCIKICWDQEDQNGPYRCPQCRETFTQRPVLKKNNILADVVESLKKTGLRAIPPDHCYDGPGDVACDFCTGTKLNAVKTCLQCLVSYCDTHLQPHYQYPALKNHKLVKASANFQENICSRHDEVRKMFCRTDQQCICYLCSIEEHKGHDIISATAERSERQKELDLSQQNIQQRIQEREKDVKVLQQEVDSINHSADRAVKDSDTSFTELIASAQIRQSEVRELIRDQQKCEVSRVEELTKRVEQEVTDLRRRHAEVEQLSQTEDHIHFLHGSTSLSRISEYEHPVSSNVRPLKYFKVVSMAVSEMRDKLKEEGTNVSEAVKRVDVLLSTLPEPKTRAEFLQYSRPITLDPNTANRKMYLSNGNRKATMTRQEQGHPDHPERFTGWGMVLSTKSLTGRCYWEVEWSGDNVDIAVSYKDIGRANIGFGTDDKSWILRCSEGMYNVRHGDIDTVIPGPLSSRVGVYLDHRAGTLSFYSVSDTMTLIHTVQTTFTQALYAGFWLVAKDIAELCDLK